MCDFVLGTENGYLLAKFVTLSEMVWEARSDTLYSARGLDNLLSGVFREWHCLDLFGEVVGGH